MAKDTVAQQAPGKEENPPLHHQLADIGHRVGAAAYVTDKFLEELGPDGPPNMDDAVYALAQQLREQARLLLALSERVQQEGAA